MTNILNGLLGGGTAKAVGGKPGSATVAGDQVVTKTEEGEIYINAEGKKVRRIKKTIVRTKSSEGLEQATVSSSNEAGPTGLGALLSSDSADRPVVSSSNKSFSEGEVYIRPDGKKVRRVKKTVGSSAASMGDAPSTTSATSSASSLGSLFSSSSPVPGRSGAATVGGDRVTAALKPAPLTTQTQEEGEIYINKDGKKVRRIKRTVVKPAPDAAAAAPKPVAGALDRMMTTSVAKSPPMFSGSATVSGDRPATKELGEIYINKDGKKVRRVRKVIPSAASAAPSSPQKPVARPVGSALSNLLEKGGGVAKKLGGSATVAGSNPTKGLSSSKSFSEGEIYIRADGKKVRRVKKATAPPPTEAENNAALSKMFSAPSPNAKMTGANSVAGDQLMAQPLHSEGEIYINKDGKKVRRVKRTVPKAEDGTPARSLERASSVSDMGTKKQAPSEGEIYIRADGKKVRRVRKTAAGAPAPAAAAPPKTSTKTINIGKKAEEVPKTTTTSINFKSVTKKVITANKLAGASGTATASKPHDIISFLEGQSKKKKKKKSGSATISGDMRVSKKAESKDDFGRPGPVTEAKKFTKKERRLSMMLDVYSSKKSSKRNGCASVAGDQVSKREFDFTGTKKKEAKKKKEQTELYRRADGKLVRRVVEEDRLRSNPAGDLADFLESKKKKKKKEQKVRNSDTVSVMDNHDAPPVTLEELRKAGELIKAKTLTRKKKKSEAAAIAAAAEAAAAKEAEARLEAKMRADAEAKAKAEAELRIKAEEAAKAAELAAQELDASEAAAAREAATQAEVAAKQAEVAARAAKAAAKTVIDLSDEEELLASSYRKMVRMGLPAEAARHKMNQDGISAKIIAAVLGEPWTEEQAPTSASGSAAPTIQLSEDELAVAKTYQRMKQMGLPEDAVRHKMQQDCVDQKIIAFVLGDPWTETASAAQNLVPAPLVPAPSAVQHVAPSVQLSDDEEVVARTYRKMKMMGLPDDAVRHKMNQDEVDAKIIAAVLGDPWTEQAPAPAPSSAQGGGPAVSAIVLSEDEAAIAKTYQRMKQMGLPEDAVRHKMDQDGVDRKIIAFVLGDPWTDSQASAPYAAVPPVSSVPAVAPTPAPPAVVSADGAILLTAEEGEIAGTYRKMMKMGLPDDAVRHKMEQDGVDAKIIAAVFGDQWTVPQATAKAPPPAASTAIVLSDDEELIASTYRKMTNMGLPADAVRHKMNQDGVDAKIIAAVLGDPWTAPAPVISSPVATPPPPAPVAPTSVAAPVSDASQGGANPYMVSVSVVPALENPEVKPGMKRSDSLGDLNPTDKFAVTMDSGNAQAANTEVKYLTLEDIAKLTGASRTDLETMVSSQRGTSGDMPHFVLQPQQQANLYAVDVPLVPMTSVPTGMVASSPEIAKATAVLAANPAIANADPKKLKVVGDNQEVVDSDLAVAARAVAALGTGDMATFLAKLQAGDMGALLTKLQEAEKRMKKFEKYLQQIGGAIPEDIDYEECKMQVERIAKRMGEIGGSDVTHPDKEEQDRLRKEYFELEQQMERFNTALMLTEEFQQQQEALEKQWEEENEAFNEAALKALRRHMPVKIKSMSEAELCNTPTPNGKFLPKAIAQKFKRTNVLMILRSNIDDIERIHPAQLESYRVTGLTLTERRALYAHLKPLGPRWEKGKSDKMVERKWTWFKMMKSNFKENLAPYLRHVAQYGPPDNHPAASKDNPNGCPLLGKQCPIKADKIIDYMSGDYGWTDQAEYEITSVTKADVDDPGAKAKQEALELMREKKSNERADLLKKHYKGKLLQVSKANGSCENMDEAMDKMEFATTRWIEFMLEKGPGESDDDKKKEVSNFTETLNEFKLGVLDFCQRSGMQTSGKKKAGGDSPDIRSAVECGLAEEVYETSQEFFSFITNRMKEIDIKDTRVEKTIELLQNMLNELHEKNVSTLAALGVKRPERSRKLKKVSDLRKEVEEKIKPEEPEAPAAEVSRPNPMGPPGGGGRGGLLDALKGGPSRGGGRGGLLDALKGGRDGGRGGGRGGLLDALKGGRDGGRGGGRGGLLDALKGGRDGGRGGGRGDLLGAIAGRAAKAGPAADAGGRGGLLAAIAARGGG